MCIEDIKWSDDLLTHHLLIDIQHKLIFTACGRVKEDLETTETEAVLNELLRFLESHFRDEELLMASVTYPEQTKHHDEHQELIAKTQEIRDEFKSDIEAALLQIKQLIPAWLSDHIKTSDMIFIPYYNKNK